MTFRLFKVIDFGTNRKRACDFLLVRHNNLGPILHRLQCSFPTNLWRHLISAIKLWSCAKSSWNFDNFRPPNFREEPQISDLILKIWVTTNMWQSGKWLPRLVSRKQETSAADQNRSVGTVLVIMYTARELAYNVAQNNPMHCICHMTTIRRQHKMSQPYQHLKLCSHCRSDQLD